MTSYLVAQISDFHIVEKGATLSGGIDTAEYLRAAVAHVNGLTPAPDLVLATGDLVNDGGSDQYEHLAELLAPLRPPVFLLPGNHDDRDVMRGTLAGHAELGTTGYVDYAIDGPVRVVAIDTARPGEPGGRIDADQLTGLDVTLAAEPGTPTIVAMHHPPFLTGITHMDTMGLDPADAGALGEVIARHPQVERVQSGHLHRSITRRWHGTIAAAVPGVAHAVHLDLAGGPPAWNREPPACTLHWWTPDTGLVTHVQTIGSYEATPY